MAQRVRVELYSDLSGDSIEEGKGETVEFSFRGVDYSIDLTEKEAAGFNKAVAMYIEHGTRQGGRKKSGSASKSSGETKAIKEWADSQGIDYPKRGRLPQSLIDQYKAAGN